MSKNIELSVQGMTCQGCVRSVTAIISATLGVAKDEVEVDLETGRARVRAPEGAAVDAVVERLGDNGFEARVVG